MTDEQLGQAKTKVLHFPTVLGAVVPTYNIPGVNQDLNFTAELLADIYLGKITKWNDPEIAKYNKGVNLPAQDIVVVHRSEEAELPTSGRTTSRKSPPSGKARSGGTPP